LASNSLAASLGYFLVPYLCKKVHFLFKAPSFKNFL